jgi:hypothetical protein
MMPETESEVDEESLSLRVSCDRPAELARRLNILEEWIPGLMESISIDLGQLSTRLNTIYASLVDHFPLEGGAHSRAKEVQFCPIAMTLVNAAAYPKGAVFINHSLINHAFATVGAAFLLMWKNVEITEDESPQTRRLRRVIGTKPLKASGRLPFGSHGEEAQALGDIFAKLVTEEEPGLLAELDHITNRFLEFVLAHEASHVVLGHTDGHLIGERFRQEMDADTLAAQVLTNALGPGQAAEEQLWLKLPPILALLEMDEIVEVDSAEEFGRMLSRRPSWDNRLLYLMELFPSKMPEQTRLQVYHSTRLAISAVWKEMEGVIGNKQLDNSGSTTCSLIG